MLWINNCNESRSYVTNMELKQFYLFADIFIMFCIVAREKCSSGYISKRSIERLRKKKTLTEVGYKIAIVY